MQFFGKVMLSKLIPWNTIVGLADRGQMCSSRETSYVSTRRRAFNSSVASFFCVTS